MIIELCVTPSRRTFVTQMSVSPSKTGLSGKVRLSSHSVTFGRRYLDGKLVLGLLALVISALAIASSHAQGSAPYRFPFCAASVPAAYGTSAERDWPEADRIFVREAVITGILEVKMSRIAALRANSSQVRQFAQRVADDHGRTNRKLKEIAWSKDLEVCSEMDERRAKLLLALQRHTGDDFDREYLTLQVDQHRRAVQLFRQHAKNGHDGELRSFAETKLPTLEAHLDEVSVLADSR